MNRFIFALLLGLASIAHAQDAVQTVLRAAPQLVAFAGSPENFYGLVVGLTEGTPAQLAAPGTDGFRRVTTFSLRTRLSAEQAAAVPSSERARISSSSESCGPRPSSRRRAHRRRARYAHRPHAGTRRAAAGPACGTALAARA